MAHDWMLAAFYSFFSDSGTLVFFCFWVTVFPVFPFSFSVASIGLGDKRDFACTLQ